jgi:hypothetical protein
MYASPASLFCLPPPRRRVIRGENAAVGLGRLLVMLLRGAGMSGGGSLVDFCLSFREGDPQRIAPACVLMPGRSYCPAEK